MPFVCPLNGSVRHFVATFSSKINRKQHPPMSDPASPLLSTQSRSRWFYSVTSLGLLALMFVGFQLFYLHGQAYPGRPLTPPIRTLVITHACLMTLWMLLTPRAEVCVTSLVSFDQKP